MRISVEDDALSVADLRSWLGQDPGTRRIPVTVESSARGEMSAFDVLEVALGNGIAAANLAVAVAAWRTARGAALGGRTVRLEHGGTTVSVTNESAEEIDRILRALREGDSEGGDPRGDAG
ncbi:MULTISPECIES: effector-associated constant component EACC1 [Streptomyces]|uniref:effector-associated constant component EACC1 n=1 Tax=Streptomyces TaxID=1883 RepID=UPI00084CDC37|nr:MULTISPECIES: hypothetical protein [Streptomyces]TFI24103.1 hypothetical protein E4P36_24730 [Streptomyces sp. 4R-3d]